MLADVSWGVYMTAVIVFLFFWYGFLIFRYYSKNPKSIFKGGFLFRSSAEKQAGRAGTFSEYKESFSTLEDAEELYDKILGAFTESDARGISRTEFENYMRFILSEYPFVKQSALREKINSLAIAESAKYPEFILTGSEMDSLWEEQQ